MENQTNRKIKNANELYANKLLRVLEYPTKDLYIDRSAGPLTITDKYRNLKAKIRMFMCCQKIRSFDISKVVGYQSILKKCVHEKDRRMMNYLL